MSIRFWFSPQYSEFKELLNILFRTLHDRTYGGVKPILWPHAPIAVPSRAIQCRNRVTLAPKNQDIDSVWFSYKFAIMIIVTSLLIGTVAVWCSSNGIGCINKVTLLSPISTGMGDGREYHLVHNQPPRPTQLASYLQWDREMSTGQSAVMLCCLEIKTGWLILLVDKRVAIRVAGSKTTRSLVNPWQTWALYWRVARD